MFGSDIIIWKQPELSNLNKKYYFRVKIVYSENNTLNIIFQNNDLLLGVAGDLIII